MPAALVIHPNNAAPLANPRANPRGFARTAIGHVNRHKGKYGLALVAILGVLWWRRRQAKAVALAGDLGGNDLQTMGRAMHAQVQAAKKREVLSDYRHADDQQLFVKAPINVAQAHYKAGYWLAVAARCSQAWSLADLADQAERAVTRTVRLKPSTTTGAISAILTSAATAIRQAAPTNPGAKAAAAALASLADPGKIQTMKNVATSQSTWEITKGTVSGGASDVADAIVYMRGLVTGEKPPGVSEWAWFAQKWGIRIAIVGSGVLLARVLFAPEYHAAKAAVSGAISRGKAVHAAAVGGAE